MNRILKIALCLALAAGGAAAQQAEHIRSRLEDASSPYVLVVAHRSNCGDAPENSREAIRNAIAAGVDMIEIDVRRSRDGHFVIMHDGTVNRTTTGKGKVSELTLEQLQTLCLKGPNGEVSEETVPRLEEILLLTKGKVLVNLDKAESYFSEILPLLEKTGTARQVVLKGKFSPKKVDELLGKERDVIYMPKVDMRIKKEGKSPTWPALGSQDRMVEVKFTTLDDSVVSEDAFQSLKKQNIRVWVNTLRVSHCEDLTDKIALKDPEQIWGRLIDRGFSVIQTDESEALLAYLKTRGLHDAASSTNTAVK